MLSSLYYGLNSMNTTKYFNGFRGIYNNEKKEYSLKPVLNKTIYTGYKKELNKYFLINKNSQIIQQFRYISQKTIFTTFLTLTTTKDINELNNNFELIVRAYENRYSLKRIAKDYNIIYNDNISINNDELQKLKDVRDKRIKEDLHKDVLIYFKKQQLIKAKNFIGNLYNFKWLKSSISKCLEFETIHSEEIYERYTKNLHKNLEKFKENEFNEWFNVFYNRFHFNDIDDTTKGHFKVLEFQKNSKPHYHILLNYYIPYSLIEKYLSNDSKIYDETFIIDNLIKYKENLHNQTLKPNELNKYYQSYKNYFKDVEFNKSYIQSSLNYVTKYLIKEPQKTKQTLYDLGINKTKVVDISLNLRKEYLEEEDLNIYEEPLFLNLDYQTPEIFNLYQEFRKQTTKKYCKYTYEDRNTLILDDFQEWLENNNIILNNPQNTLIQLVEKEYFNKFKYHPEPYNYNKPLSSHWYKWNLKKVLFKLNQDNNNILKPIDKILNSYQEDSNKLDFYSKFRNNKINLLLGGAGSGKSFTLSNLNYYNNSNNQVLYITYKKKAKNELMNKLKKQFNENFFCDNIDNFLKKRGEELYFLNVNNCYDPVKPLILIIDEIGNISTKQLYDLLCGINLNKVVKLVFAGDFNQDTPFKDISGSNSLIPELKTLNFIYYTHLSKNFRAKENPILIKEFETLQNNNSLNNFSYIDYYSNPQETLKLIQNKFKQYSQDLTIITNSKKLRNFINTLILNDYQDNKHIYGNLRYIADKNHSTYNIINCEEYYFNKEDENYIFLYNKDKSLKIPKYIFYEFFIPGFAVTTSKVQGAGYPHILVMFDNYSNKLLNKNLLYTSITRAELTAEVYFQFEDTYKKCISNFITNTDEYNFSNIETINYNCSLLRET